MPNKHNFSRRHHIPKMTLLQLVPASRVELVFEELRAIGERTEYGLEQERSAVYAARQSSCDQGQARSTHRPSTEDTQYGHLVPPRFSRFRLNKASELPLDRKSVM